MSYVSYRFGAGTSAVSGSTLVYRSTETTTGSPQWDAELYDYLSAHSLVTNPDRITPTQDGYFRFWAHWDDGLGGTTTARQMAVRDSGGVALSHGLGGTNADTGIMCSGIMNLTTGQYGLTTSDSSVTWKANNSTWLSCEQMNSGTRFCRVWNNGTQATGALAPVTFNQTEINTGGFTHSTVSNTERISVDGGSGITLVRASGSFITTSGFNGFLHSHTKKNGSAADGLPQHSSHAAGGTKLISWMSAPIEVVAGTDYLGVDVFTSAAATLASGGSDARVWFQVEEINPSHYSNYQRVMATCASGFTLSNGSFGAVTFDAEIYDTCAGWAVGDPTKFYVPSGALWARMSWGLTAASGSSVSVSGTTSGSAFSTTGDPAGFLSSVANTKHLSGVSAWVPVVAGDYFQLQAKVNAGGITTQGATYCAMEFTS